MLCENPGDVQGWQTDHEGKLRVAYAIVDGVNSQIRYRATVQTRTYDQFQAERRLRVLHSRQ